MGEAQEEVANEAEVGVATLFRRFGSKDDLIKHFVEHNAPRRFINDNQLSSYKGFAKLCHITSAMLGFMHKNRELVRLVIWGSADDQKYLRSLRNDGKSTSARLVEFFTEEINVGRLESEISPKNLAVQLFGMIQAHALLSDPEIFNLEQSQEAIVKMFSQFFKEQNDE